MQKFQLLSLLITILFGFQLNAQDVYDKITSNIKNEMCECMTDKIEESSELEISEMTANCVSGILIQFESDIKNVPEGKTKDEHSQFLSNLPEVIGYSVFQDCPYACKQINLQSNFELLVNNCQEMFFQESKGLINSREVCECSVNDFIEYICNNSLVGVDRKKADYDPAFAETSLRKCIKENVEYLYNPESRNQNLLVMLYKEKLEEDESFQAIDVDKYCDCYFTNIAEMELSEDELIEELFNPDKISKVIRKCKEFAADKKG